MNTPTDALRDRRVLITGGLGFIGSTLAQRCVELGAHVTIYDCLDPRSGGNMQNVAEIKDKAKIVLNDMRQFEGLAPSVRDAEIIFNCAAYTSHPSSMKDPLVDIDVNCKGVINLLEAARRFNPEARIVHIGTSTQTGRMVRSPIDELHPEFPADIYSANKSASEKYVLIYGTAYGLPVSVIRLANVYGPRSHVKSPEFGFVNYFIGLALQGKELTVFGEGRQLRTITFVDDCVEALLLGATDARALGQVFFAVSDAQLSVREIAETIVRVIGRGSVRYVDWPRDREVIDIGDALISNAKIRETLGWRAQVGLDDGMARTRDYFLPVLKQYLR